MEINKERLLDQYSKNAPDRWKVRGYARLPTALLMDTRITKTALLVYWVLAAHTFKGKEVCFPSLKTLATEAHCVKNTAIKATKELERLGYLRVERAKKGSKKRNRYFIQKGIR